MVEVIEDVIVLVEVDVGVISKVGKELLLNVVVLVDVLEAVDVTDSRRPFALRFLISISDSTGGDVATRPILSNNNNQRMSI